MALGGAIQAVGGAFQAVGGAFQAVVGAFQTVGGAFQAVDGALQHTPMVDIRALRSTNFVRLCVSTVGVGGGGFVCYVFYSMAAILVEHAADPFFCNGYDKLHLFEILQCHVGKVNINAIPTQLLHFI